MSRKTSRTWERERIKKLRELKMKLRLDLEYEVTEQDKKAGLKTNAHTTRVLIREAIGSVKSQGLEGRERKLYAQIDRGISVALKHNEKLIEEKKETGFINEIAINGEHLEFLKSVMNLWKVRPALAVWWDTLMTHLEELSSSESEPAELIE